MDLGEEGLSANRCNNLRSDFSGHSRRFSRFPLLLKVLDVTRSLSIQLHLSDAHKELIPSGNIGIDEACLLSRKPRSARCELLSLPNGPGDDTADADRIRPSPVLR